MGVDGQADLVGGRFQRHGQADFGDEFRRVGADDVRAEDFAVRLAQDQLHKALGVARSDRLAAGLVGEFPHFILESLFLCRLFGHADAGDLRLAVGAAGERGHLMRFLARDEKPLHRLDGLMRGDVREPRRPDDVARAVDALHRSLVAVVGLEIAAIEFELEARAEQSVEVRLDADGDEQMLRLHGFAACDGELDALVADLGLFDLGVGENFDALFREIALEQFRDFGVLHRQDLRQHFEDRDFRSEGVEEIGELAADGPGPEDDDRLRQRLDRERLAAGQDFFAIDFHAGEGLRPRAGANQDRLAGERLRLAVRAGDDDFFIGLNLRLADDVIDLLAFEKILDALGHRVGNRAAAPHDLRKIEFHFAGKFEAVIGHVPQELLDLGALEQRLGRDAAPVEAGAPGAFHFDTHHFFAELGRADRPDITRRAAANHNEVVVHKALSLTQVLSQKRLQRHKRTFLREFGDGGVVRRWLPRRGIKLESPHEIGLDQMSE